MPANFSAGAPYVSLWTADLRCDTSDPAVHAVEAVLQTSCSLHKPLEHSYRSIPVHDEQCDADHAHAGAGGACSTQRLTGLACQHVASAHIPMWDLPPAGPAVMHLSAMTVMEQPMRTMQLRAAARSLSRSCTCLAGFRDSGFKIPVKSVAQLTLPWAPLLKKAVTGLMLEPA